MIKVHLYTITYNEEIILPFHIEYWVKMISDGIDLKVTVFDNESDDSTLEILHKEPFIDVVSYHTEGCDDFALRNIKNMAWKENNDADWTIVVDADEIMYCKDWNKTLSKLKEDNISIVWPNWYLLASTEVPTHMDGVLLHNQRPMMYKYRQYGNKATLFDNNKLLEIGYGIGAHSITPIPKDGVAMHTAREGETDIFCFHIDKRLSEDYFVEQMKERDKRRGVLNKLYGFGSHYSKPEEQHRLEYKNIVNEAVDIRYIINNNGRH